MTAAWPLLPPRTGAIDRPPRSLHARHIQPPPCASPCRAVCAKEKRSLLFPRQPAHSALLSPSASAPSLPCSFAPSTEVLTTAHRSRAPRSHAKPAAEPPSAARHHRSTEPAPSFGCRGRLPVECHLRPPMCSSVTAVTSARAHRRSTNLEPAPSTSSPAYCHWFPTTGLLHRREPTMVSPSAACAPNRDPHLRG
jgi:hypothetical protein